MCFLLKMACWTWLALAGSQGENPSKDYGEESGVTSLAPPPPPAPAVEPERLTMVTYHVADLVATDDCELYREISTRPGHIISQAGAAEASEIGIPSKSIVAKTQCPAERKCPAKTTENELITLIATTVAPETWNSGGGRGTIQYMPLGMSLVINQTEDVQRQVADLLAALRRLNDEIHKQYTLEIKLVQAQESGDSNVVAMPRITVFQKRWFTVFLGKSVALKDGTIQDLLGRPTPGTVAAYVKGPLEMTGEKAEARMENGSTEPAADEVQVGFVVRGKVTPSEGKRLRLDLVLQKNDIDSASRDDFVVVGNYLRTVQRVLPDQSFERVLQEDDQGEPLLWVEVVVREMPSEVQESKGVPSSAPGRPSPR